jgi:hypothetical protein
MRRIRLDTVIERRLLLNYRADPDVVTRVLPAPFRPQVRNGYAVVGICLLRMGRARLAGFPVGVGFGSENAAHRFAVDWDGADGLRKGLFMPRLDSASRRDVAPRLNVAAGGRLFPGAQQRAEFDVTERPDRLRVAYATSDGTTAVDVDVWTTEKLVGSALFDDAADASEFFRLGSAGFSAGRCPNGFEEIEPATSKWQVDPCIVGRAASSFYDDRSVFPAGSIELDSALVMRPRGR